jgi:hypothetical protein
MICLPSVPSLVLRSRFRTETYKVSQTCPKKSKQRDTTPDKPLEPIIGADIFSGENDELAFQNSDVQHVF